MKHKLLLSLLMISTLAFAEGEQTAEPEVEERGFVSQDQHIQNLIDNDDELKTALETNCKDKPQEEKGSCLWESLSDDKKAEVQKKLAVEDESKGDQVIKHEGRSLSTIQVNHSPGDERAIGKVRDFFKEKLSKEIFGQEKNGTKLANMNHFQFYNMYKTQISQNILMTISDYCLQANKGDYLIPAELVIENDTREENEKELRKDNDRVKENRTARMKQLGEIQDIKGGSSYAHWGACLKAIPQICWGEKSNITQTVDEGKKTKTTVSDFEEQSGSKYCEDLGKGTTTCERDYRFSRGLACEVVSSLKAARQNIKEVVEIQNKLKDVYKQKSVGFAGAAAKNADLSNMNYLTSNQFNKESGFKDASKKELELLEKCRTEYEANKAACDRYIIKDNKKAEQMATDYNFKSQAYSDQLKESFNDNPEKAKIVVQEYLKEAGYSDQRIEELTSTNDKIAQLQVDIKRRFDAEREELSKRIASKIKGRTIAKIDPNAPSDEVPSGSSAGDVFSKIKNELQQRHEQYAELIKYNNIVSAFLEIDKDGKKERTNTAALYAELDDTDKDDSGRGVASGVALDNLRDLGLQKADGGATENSINIENISDILKFSGEKEVEELKE